jgi:hypothetical protein
LAPPPWTADPDSGLQRTDLAAFGVWLRQRRAEAGEPVLLRNSGTRRTESKRALLQAIEASGGRW